MSIFEELRQKFLKDLQDGLRFPVKDKEGNWGEHWVSYQDILKSCCTNVVKKIVFLDKYKTIAPVESFSNEEQNKWKAFVDEIFQDKPEEFKTDAVKIIYTIGTLT